MPEDIPTKQIGELLDEVSTKVPKLINGLMDTLYSAESGKKMGEAVGNFYKELIDSGMPQDVAVSMARDYMVSIKDITKGIKEN